MKNIIIFIVLIAICVGGYYYYVRKPTDINTVKNDLTTAKDTIIATTNTGIDTAIQSALKSVSSVAPIYYVQNRNYGVSETQNICNDTTNAGSIGGVISEVQKYTNAVSCTVATDYPSRSFTITAPSRVSDGKYFCSDQTGIVSLIPSISSSPFQLGVKCK